MKILVAFVLLFASVVHSENCPDHTFCVLFGARCCPNKDDVCCPNSEFCYPAGYICPLQRMSERFSQGIQTAEKIRKPVARFVFHKF
ncbi:hypothetical protein L596_023171 [Steinernema carpocapsae]|uniref:Granulins domain-containing protein n=1 Tax=Steinernema carpocapsae TaxID=34508 RepID=A0A4U5MCW5_STECR|nr:hypothetical protein L596_023171 [Steinernema carpocapsae]